MVHPYISSAFPAKPAVIDLTRDSCEFDDSEVEVVAEVPAPELPSAVEVHERRIVQPDVVELSESDELEKADDVLYLGTHQQPSCSGVEVQDEEEDEVEIVQFVKEVERQEDADDVEIVAEICHTPKGALAASRKSIENARDQSSNVNLVARDYLLDMIEKMGGNAVQYPSRDDLASSVGEKVDRRRPFRTTKRVIDGYDGIRRVRNVLDKYGKQKSSRISADSSYRPDDAVRSIERQSSSDQPSEDGDNAASVSGSAVTDDVSGAIERQSSRSMTPMSTQSSGVDRLTELLEKLNSFGQRPTPEQKYSRFVAERRELRDREIALKEEVRIRGLARQASREQIEEQARRRLELIGIRPPAPKPKVKDEFPQLSDEAVALCDRVWNRRLPPSEEFSEGFGIKLTRKDLSTLCGLDWLNDEVINFYLQLVCQRSNETKGLPKVYAFNTFFYANISTKGYASVKRWTRKVDIFAHDLLLVPVHLSVHWCMAVIDLAEKRIDYYDSLLGKNQKCLEHLKRYLMEESNDKKKQNFSFDGWDFNLRTDIPRQLNGSDCGVFACKFAEFASRRAPIVFTQEHMPYYRRRMLYELVTKKLL
ncbi:Ulp1 protease family, catalytic domain protein [Teladorsagia circumcincta]|uniref:Ulp1 protease family, catalytic domain protein n=1 Tax=Teladorsagia circumcincta TaxID=45464 RepID=A0A2G9UBS3_TELCI|nr:Ulp1 protease family, catalytic domain protein [Teladorsagia circumcincta]